MFGGCLWLNFEYSRDPYENNTGGGWRGGIRHGYPFVLWDSGREAYTQSDNGGLGLYSRSYGGLVVSGFIANAAVLIATMTAGGLLLEWALRRRAERHPQAALFSSLQGRRLHARTLAALFGVAGLLLWLNLRVDTDYTGQPAARNYEQTMGFPLTMYTASQPVLSQVPAPIRVSGAATLIYLQDNPNVWYRIARYEHPHIVFNVVFAAFVLGLVAYANERLVRRTLSTQTSSAS